MFLKHSDKGHWLQNAPFFYFIVQATKLGGVGRRDTADQRNFYKMSSVTIMHYFKQQYNTC